MSILTRRLALWGGAAAIATGGFAFMASNSFAGVTPGAGVGTHTVSGYVISNTEFTACGQTTATNHTNFHTTPQRLCYAHFYAKPASPTAATVGTAWVKFTLTTGAKTQWYKCTVKTIYTGAKNRYVVCDLRPTSLTPGPVVTITVAAIDSAKP